MISIRDLRKIYTTDKKESVALDGVSFDLPSKGMIFVVGKSGCGKTTLLNIIGGLDNPSSGDVYVNDKGLTSFTVRELDNYRNTTIGFVFQDFCLIDKLTVLENIKLSLEFQDSKKHVRYKALLYKMGLEGLENRKPKQLSAGQKQRVAIARAIVKDPDVLLADEPTGNVDEKTSYQILNILKEISKNKLVVVISHNLQEAYKYADRIIELKDGKVISDKQINKNFSDKLVINDKETILPGDGVVSKEKLKLINKKVAESKGDYRISQFEEKFIDFNEKIDDSKNHLRRAKMNIKTIFKYSKFFFNKKIIFNLFIILLITLVTSFYSILQLMSGNDNNEELNRIAYEKGYTEDIFSVYGGKVLQVDKDDEVAIDENYGDQLDKLISVPLQLNSATGVSTYVRSVNISGKHCIYSYGVLLTNEENLLFRHGINNKLEVLSGEIKSDGVGVIITDFFADSILHYYPSRYTSYDDIVNGGYILERIDVDAVIKTDVYERFAHFFTDNVLLSETERSILAHEYTVLYSFNENFISDYKQDYLNNVVDPKFGH